MSDELFPTLPGLAWPIQRTVLAAPVAIKTTPSRREFRSRASSAPLYRFTLNFEFLRATQAYPEWQALMGFYNRRGGTFDDFVFVDEMDKAVLDQAIGVGDGSTKKFQLARSLGGWLDAVYAPVGAQTIKVAGLTVSPVSISATGLVELASAPANGAAVTWSGGFGWRCRFADEMADFHRFMGSFFELKKLQLITIKPL